MEGNELFFEVQELPDDTKLICYVYTENGATYALQYEKLSRSEQSREQHNVYLVKRYPNQDKNVEEYADKGEFYDLREGDMIRVYYDGNAVHLDQKIPGESSEEDRYFSLPDSHDSYISEDTFAPCKDTEWLKEITSDQFYNYAAVTEEITEASTQSEEITERSNQTKTDSKDATVEKQNTEDTYAVTSDPGPDSTPDVHVNVPKLVGLIVLIVLALFVILFHNQIKDWLSTLVDNILNNGAPKPQTYKEQPKRPASPGSGTSSLAFGRKTTSGSSPTMQSIDAQSYSGDMVSEHLTPSKSNETLRPAQQSTEVAAHTNSLHMGFVGSCMPCIGLGEITRIIEMVELEFSYDETTMKFDVRSKNNSDISFIRDLDMELKGREMFFAAADEKQLLVATEISKNKIRLEPIRDVCDSQIGDILLIIIRGMHLAEDAQTRSEAVYALMQTILNAEKRPRAYTDVCLYEKLDTYSDKRSYKLTPQPDNDLLCLLTFVCLTPNVDDNPTSLLNAQMFARKLLGVLDNSFSVIETAPTLPQSPVQQQPPAQSTPPVQSDPEVPPQPDFETLRKKRNQAIRETLEAVRRDPYQEKQMSKHGKITFYSLADAVTRTDSPISVVTRTYRNTAQFVCIDNELWLNPLKGDYRWVEEVMGQELKLRELQELFEITGSGRTEYSCQEPAILSLQEESLKVTQKGILVRC